MSRKNGNIAFNTHSSRTRPQATLSWHDTTFHHSGYYRKSCVTTWLTCINCVTLTYVRLLSGHMTHLSEKVYSQVEVELKQETR